MTLPFRTLSLPLSLCVALSACTGEDSASTQQPTSPSVAIDSLNAQQIASNAIITSDTILLGSSGATGRGAIAKSSLNSEAAAITLSNCQVSGTVDITMDISNILTGVSVGDSITTVYDNCNQNGNALLNGELQLEFTRALGANLLFQTTYDLGARTSFINFSVSTAPNISSSLNGVVSMEAAISQEMQSVGVRSDKLTSINGTRTSTIQNWVGSSAYYPATKTTVASSGGTITDSGINGTYDVSTITPFQTISGNFPHTGVMVVKGDKSGLVLTALDDTMVEIGIDVNDDNVADFTKEVLWTELHTVELPQTNL